MATEDELWDMSDEDLALAVKEAHAQEQSPETDVEETSVDEEITDSEHSEEEPDEEVEITSEQDENTGQDQPENTEESDHNSDEAETEEVSEEETEEGAETNPDGDDEAAEAESSEETEEEKAEEQPTRSYSFRANGKDYEFSSDEIVDQFPKIFGQAMDYTKKMQTIKPWRKTIDALEGAELSHDDVNLMIDVLKGDKTAITEVLKRTGTDTLEIDTEADSNYVAKNYGRNESALAISDIVDEISKDPEYATTHSILSKEWDENSWTAMNDNPELIKLLHIDVKSGVYATLQPIAEKLKVFDGGKGSDLDYYKSAAQQHARKQEQLESVKKQQSYKEEQRVEKAKASEQAKVDSIKAENAKRAAAKTASAKRKAAAPTKSVTSERPAVDYLNDSDEDFDKWYKELQESV